MIVRAAIVVTILLISTASALSAVAGPALSPPAAALAGPICIAIMDPEVVADVPANYRKTMAATIDVLLTESLAKQQGLVLVDRQALEKVLAEQTAKVDGLTQVKAGEVAESLRPFWSAGVLICAQVDAKAQVVIVEAVSAQTGQLIASVYTTGKMASADDVAKAIEPRLQSLGANITRNAARIQDKPLLEISGKLTGGLTRLAWMVDDLTDAAGAKVATNDRVVWLVPRQPLVTKEERLLRVMGLGEARKGDTVAGLSPVPQMRLTFELTDSAKTGVTFEKTPIAINLSLRRGQDKPLETQIAGEAGQWDVCRDKAVTWLGGQLVAMDGHAIPAAGDDFARAKQLAAEELSSVAPWTSLSADQQKALQVALRARVAHHALRAAHLDPTSEQAAYLVACFVDSLYRREGKDESEMSLAAIDRAIVETQRYLDRFKQTQIEHHRQLLDRLSVLGIFALWRFNQGPAHMDDLLREPDVRLYPYASVCVRAMAEYGHLGNVDERYHNSNSFAAFSFNLLSSLIPCIPADKLDEEHEYWRNFYATKVDKIVKQKNLTDFNNDRPAPWALIDAAFQARKKNSSAVRADLELLAREFPRSQGHVWGGDQWTPPQIPILLQAAGDKEWQTWLPQFGAPEQANVSISEMTAFMSRLSPSSPGVWDYATLPQLAGQELAIPIEVHLAGDIPGHDFSRTVEALTVAGGDLWLTTPAGLPGSLEHLVKLFVLPLDAQGRATDKATAIVWPESDKLAGPPDVTCHYVTNENHISTVWLGTRQHGLARFDKKDGRWVGRWYNSKRGMPSDGVTRITTCRNRSATELLIVDQNSRRQYTNATSTYEGAKLMVWALNISTGQSTLIHNGDQDKEHIDMPVLELANGQRRLLELAGESVYDQPPEIGDMRGSASGTLPGLYENPVPFTVGPDGTRRIWAVAGDVLQGFDNVTVAPMKGGCPGQSASRHIAPAVSNQVGFVLGMVAAWPGSERDVSAPNWPASEYVVFAVGRGNVLWMVFNGGDVGWDRCRFLVGYRPAAPGSKDWAVEDAWIGPFYASDKELIYGLQPEGQKNLLLTTHNHILRLDSDDLVAQASKAGAVHTTIQWRRGFQDRAAKGSWQAVVPLLIVNGQFEQAEKLLDSRAAELGDSGAAGEEGLRLLLWRARLLAEQKDRLDEAIKLYAQAAEHPKAGGAGEAFARANEIVLLHRAARWQEMLDLAERVQAKYSQMKATNNDSGMGWYIADAHRNLDMQSPPAKRGPNPATRPAAAPAR